MVFDCWRILIYICPSFYFVSVLPGYQPPAWKINNGWMQTQGFGEVIIHIRTGIMNRIVWIFLKKQFLLILRDQSTSHSGRAKDVHSLSCYRFLHQCLCSLIIKIHHALRKTACSHCGDRYLVHPADPLALKTLGFQQ